MPGEPEVAGQGVPTSRPAANPKTIAVLEMIAQGRSYEQILHARPDLTYHDIFAAAEEALAQLTKRKVSAQEAARRRHARAYEKWTPEEERELEQLIDRGHTVAQIAGRLQRQRSAIRSRILRLGLVGRLSLKEQERLKRIMDQGDAPGGLCGPGKQPAGTGGSRST